MTIRQAPPAQDHGVTLIELLVSIVLVGLVVVATLTALTSGITATRVDRDHSNAHAWLQTAADRLYASTLVSCSPDPLAPAVAYDALVKLTDNPEGWPPSSIDVIRVEFWNITRDATEHKTEFWHESTCDAGDSNLQRVTLRVHDPDNFAVIEEVQVIIDD